MRWPAEQQETLEGYVVRYLDDDLSRTVAQQLVNAPGQLLGRGEVYKPGSRGFSVRVGIDGHDCFLKHYRPRNLWDRVRYAFRTSRAVQTWTVNLAMYRLGLPVPRPLACIEKRTLRLLGDSYHLMDFVPETTNLHEAWAVMTTEERGAALTILGRHLGDMHRLGVAHGDLKWYNILVSTPGEECRVTLVDIDAARLGCQKDFARLNKDLERFLRDLDASPDGPLLKDSFLSIYRSTLEVSVTPQPEAVEG